MSRSNYFGKLIISKCNDDYDTYHDLDLILVRGDRNKIDIDHQIDKLVVNGDNNKIKIGASGDIGEVKLRGNNNIIFSRYLTSLLIIGMKKAKMKIQKEKVKNMKEIDIIILEII